MAEEKKKTTTAKKKTTTKTKEEKAKVEEKKEPSMITDFSNISPELMQQMFNMFMQIQQQNKVEEVKEEPVVEKPKKITKSYLKTIKDKEIMVRSIYGTVIFKSPKTGITYKWIESGDEEIMSIDEVLAMQSTSPRYLESPWLIIDDEEVIEGLGLIGLYEVINKVSDVDELLEMNIDEIKKIIEKAPKEYKNILAGEMFARVNNKTLTDYVLIKDLEKVLGTTLLF